METITLDFDNSAYMALVQRYKELSNGGGGGGGGAGDDIPFDLVGYITEIDTGRIDAAYMNSRFEKYLKNLRQDGVTEEQLQASLDELHKSFATLTQDEQKYAEIFLHDVQRGDVLVEDIIQNFPTNRLLFGYSIAGTEGAKLYSKLDVVSNLCFDKILGDALTNKKLLNLIKEKDYEVLHLCGLDECGCVTSTALGAIKRGIKAEILRKGTASVFPKKKITKAHRKLNEAGVKII